MSVSGKYAIGPNITWFFQTSNLKVIVANRNCIIVNEAYDSHHSLAFGASERINFIHPVE